MGRNDEKEKGRSFKKVEDNTFDNCSYQWSQTWGVPQVRIVRKEEHFRVEVTCLELVQR